MLAIECEVPKTKTPKTLILHHKEMLGQQEHVVGPKAAAAKPKTVNPTKTQLKSLEIRNNELEPNNASLSIQFLPWEREIYPSASHQR